MLWSPWTYNFSEECYEWQQMNVVDHLWKTGRHGGSSQELATHCCQWDWSRKGVTAQDAALVTAALQMIHQQRPSRLGGSTAIESSSPDSSLITPRLYRFTFDPKAFFAPNRGFALSSNQRKNHPPFLSFCLADEMCCLFLHSFIVICTKKVVVKYGKEVRKDLQTNPWLFRDADNLLNHHNPTVPNRWDINYEPKGSWLFS